MSPLMTFIDVLKDNAKKLPCKERTECILLPRCVRGEVVVELESRRRAWFARMQEERQSLLPKPMLRPRTCLPIRQADHQNEKNLN
jgi:hypothetical protein